MTEKKMAEKNRERWAEAFTILACICINSTINNELLRNSIGKIKVFTLSQNQNQ